MSIEFPKKIERDFIEALPIEREGTEIVLQRHGEYERSADSSRVGSLTPEGAEEISKRAETFFRSLFDALPEPERETVDILVIGSDTQYRGGGRRSLETANITIAGIKQILSEYGLKEKQLLNASRTFAGDGAARPMPALREPQMFEDSPEFVEFLKNKYGGMNKDFWIAFEEDVEKEKRVAMGAEGPEEIVDRLKHALAILSRFSQMYHRAHQDRRLIIWATTHYDTISPFVKQEIFKVGKDVPLAVDYGAGIAIEITPDGEMKTKIKDTEYQIDAEKH